MPILRLLLMLALSATPLSAAPDRLGTFIRWWVQERDISKRMDFLETIERLSGGDPAVVEKAIRAGADRRHSKTPALVASGRLPRFPEDKVKILPLDDSAGRVASLFLPARYDPQRSYPLVIDMGTVMQPASDAITVKLNLLPKQYPTHVAKTESLVLSLLVHLFELVHVDPARVYLQAEGDVAKLAWYIALHNPDRFAGILGAFGAWKDGAALAPNAKTFTALVIAPHRTSRLLDPFMEKMAAENPAHRLVRRPGTTAAQDRELLPHIRDWYDTTKREPAPKEISLVLDRPGRIRSFWLSAAPHVPSKKKGRIGPWKRQAMTTKATITARIEDDNNVVVTTNRSIAGFTIYLDRRLLDPNRRIRVRINGGVPQSTTAFPDVEDLLEDYRERRDPQLLYACKCAFPMR